MGDLSKNFSSEEYECPHCHQSPMDPLLISVLQIIRDHVKLPIVVNSGYRCPEHNKRVGGVVERPDKPGSGSQHLYGRAADIYVPGWSNTQLLNVIRTLTVAKKIYVGYAYIIKNSNRAVHIDVRIPESNTVRGWMK